MARGGELPLDGGRRRRKRRKRLQLPLEGAARASAKRTRTPSRRRNVSGRSQVSRPDEGGACATTKDAAPRMTDPVVRRSAANLWTAL